MILWGPPRGPDVDPALQQPGSRVLALRRKVNAVDNRGYQASVMAAVVQSVVRCFDWACSVPPDRSAVVEPHVRGHAR